MGAKQVIPIQRTTSVSKTVLTQQYTESDDSCESNSGSDTPDIRHSSSRPTLTSFNRSSKFSPSVSSINVQSFSKHSPTLSPPDFKENLDFKPGQGSPTFPLDEETNLKRGVKQFTTTTQRLVSQQASARKWERVIQFEDVGALEEICREKRPRRSGGTAVVHAVYKLNKKKVVVQEQEEQVGDDKNVVGILREAAVVKFESQSARRKSVNELKSPSASKLPSVLPASSFLQTPRSDNNSECLMPTKRYTIRSPQDVKLAQLIDKTQSRKSRAENSWAWKGSKGLAGRQ